DGRIRFGGIYSVGYQVAGSRTHRDSTTTTAPLWASSFNMQGHRAGMSATFSGVSDKFFTSSGFIGRNGLVHANVDPSWTLYGRQGGFIQRFTGDIVEDGTWQYQNFIHGRHRQDQKTHFNANASLRGGWNTSLGVFIESFG